MAVKRKAARRTDGDEEIERVMSREGASRVSAEGAWGRFREQRRSGGTT